MRDRFPMPPGHMRRPGVQPYELQPPRGGGGFGIAHALFPWIFLLLFAALVAVAIVALVRFSKQTTGRSGGATSPPRDEVVRSADPALQEVRTRYARGEIDREEYLEKSSDLGEARPRGSPPST